MPTPVLRVLAVLTATAATATTALLAGCGSTLDGGGSVPTPAPSAGSSAGSSGGSSGGSSSGSPANRFARTPVSTSIGDPVALDFCRAIGLTPLRRAGLAPSFAASQYVPGCTIDYIVPGTRVSGSVLAFVTSGRSNAAPGRTSSTVSGLTVYRFPFDAGSGNCERDVVARGVTVKVTITLSGATVTPMEGLDCSATTAVSTRLAQVMAGRDLPALSLARPSVTSLDACAIARAADIASSSLLAGASPTGSDFGIGCGFVGRATLYVDPVLERAAVPENTHAVTAGGHTVYADDDNGTRQCAFTSIQGAAGDGRHEALLAVTSPAGTGDLPSDACDVTQQLLLRYLDTAGLR